MEDSIRDLDGAFSYLCATREGLGVARDRIGSMPCVIAETDDWVAVASEGIAVHGAFGGRRGAGARSASSAWGGSRRGRL